MTSSVILIDKELGMTSAGVVARLKKKFGFNKIGHAGTLDPDATGLLICVTNHATRLLAYAQKGFKTYTGTIILGLETDTDDISGKEIRRSDLIPDDLKLIQDQARAFVGKIKQQPPNYSAVKVDGQRAYKLARAGAEIDLTFKEVEVTSFDLKFYAHNKLEYSVVCGSGTYIRSLARDLGRALGCGACTESINRATSAPFDLTQAKKLDQIDSSDFLHWSTILPQWPVIDLEPQQVAFLKNGDLRVFSSSIFVNRHAQEPENVLYRDIESGQLLGLLNNTFGTWKILVNIGE